MADSKISALTADTSPTSDDLIVTVNDPGGTPVNKKVTLADLTKGLSVMVGDSGSGGTKGLVPAPASGDAAAGKFLKADGTFAVPATGGSGGIGDVVGPGSATDNAVARFDSTTGKLIQNSTITIDDTGAITVPEMAAPSTPGANKVALYAKSDGLLYSKDDAGTETLVSGGAGGGSIAPLVVESANVVAQRNGANAQTLNLYQNYASAGATYNRLSFKFSTNDPTIETESDSGSGGNLLLKKGSTSLVWSGSTFTPSSSGTINLGTSSALWNETHSNQFWMPAAGAVVWNGRTQMSSPAAGLLQWLNGSNSGSGTIQFGSRTPSQITADQNNYALSLTGYFQRLSSDASRSITGISGGSDGQIHLLVNIGTNPIVLKHDDSGSTATNRLYCSTGADITLTSTSTAKQAAEIIYDNTLQRWLVYKRS